MSKIVPGLSKAERDFVRATRALADDFEVFLRVTRAGDNPAFIRFLYGILCHLCPEIALLDNLRMSRWGSTESRKSAKAREVV